MAGRATDWAAIIAEAVRWFGLSGLSWADEGGQKLVFPAQRGDEAVMVKIIDLRKPGIDGGITLERARREVDVLGRIKHRNVVRLVEGMVELGGTPPLAVAWLEECLDGQDLRELLGAPWDATDVVRLGLDVAGGLAAFHAESVVHRDLSPGNVFACTDGRFVVLDPGFGRHLDRSSLTGQWIVGTRGHLSPDHLSRRGLRPAADVFAVGILLYLALTGDYPFSPDDPDYEARLYSERAPSVAVLRPDLAGDLVAVVDRCLHRHSGRRFRDGAELAKALEAL